MSVMPRKETHNVYIDEINHAWVGEFRVGSPPESAVYYAEIPSNDDINWIAGVPSVVDIEFLTLSPFYPSLRLDVMVEKNVESRFHLNHPPFAGCKFWMSLDKLDWNLMPKYVPIAEYTIGVCYSGKEDSHRTVKVKSDSLSKAMALGFKELKPSIIENVRHIATGPNEDYVEYQKKFKSKPFK